MVSLLMVTHTQSSASDDEVFLIEGVLLCSSHFTALQPRDYTKTLSSIQV